MDKVQKHNSFKLLTVGDWKWQWTSLNVKSQRRGPPCRLASVFRVTLPWRWRQHGPPKRRYPAATLHGVTIQKTLT